MAQMIPIELSSNVRNDPKLQAEVKVYDTLRDALDDSWLVIHSVCWQDTRGREGSSRDGEADFLVGHPELGLLILEVKGGKEIICDGQSDQWFSISHSGHKNGIKNPFMQARRNKHALRNYLEARHMSDDSLAIMEAVVFPGCAPTDYKSLRPYMSKSNIIDSTHFADIEGKIREVISDQRGSHLIEKSTVKKLITGTRKYLGQTIEMRNPLSAEINDEAKEIIKLTADQYKILNKFRRCRRAAISGCAGSGKTMLAMEKARLLNLDGFETLYVSKNEPIVTHLKALGKKMTNVEFLTYEQICRKAAKSLGSVKVEGENKAEIIEEAARTGKLEKYGAIIIDEGQDLNEYDWLALEGLVDEDKGGVFYLFFDDNQKIYSTVRNNIPNNWVPIVLEENVRNTRVIFKFFESFYQGEEEVFPRGPSGRTEERESYKDDRDMKHKLSKVMHRLTSHELIKANDIVLLTPRKLKKSALYEFKQCNGVDLVSKRPQKSNEVLVSPIGDFKGLESPIVIVCEIDEEFLKNEHMTSLCYSGFSRAQNHLILLTKGDVLSQLIDVISEKQ